MPTVDDRPPGSSTRRRFLAWTGVGSAGLLAGCSNERSPDDDTGDGGGTQSYDAQFDVFDPTTSATAHTDRHLNPFNPSQSGCWHPGANVFDQPILYSKPNDELYPHIATGWEKSDETTLDVTFSDQWTWHDGDQVVAQDWATQLQLALEILRSTAEPGERPHQVIESVEAVDDRLIRIHLHNSFTSKYVFQNWLNGSLGDNSRGLYTKHDGQWTQWLEQLRDAEGDEAESVLEEITTTSSPELSAETVGNGPFRVSAVGDIETIMVKYEDHPNAEDINFEKYSLKLFSDAEQPSQPYIAEQVDAAHRGFPVADDIESQLPDEHTLINEMRSSNKLFAFNCGYETDGETPFDSANVRKAVCHIFDQQQVEQLLQGVNRPFEWPPCRIPGEVLRDDTHPSVERVQNFTRYGQNDTDRAAELLREEGYERGEGGDWVTPDGERFEIRFMNAPDRPDFQVLGRNLEEFGIAVDQESFDQATFDERRQNGNYHMMPDASGADGVSTMWGTGLILEWLPSILHYPVEAEIPIPIGDPDGSSGTKTIDLAEHIVQWHTTDEERYHRELMWWWNQTVPEMEVMYEPNAGAYNGADWEIEMPDEGIRDVLYAAPKLSDGAIRYTGD
ncbi:ABC transporter substrate-binding protein [Halomontanus rarus]|uniref:ABC transporter substrate-binding protein n=1 Tax=Halomontanus rarus TaxID=3034020 RepID=UPI001A98818C